MFRRTVQGCWLPTPFASFPLTSPPVRHRVPSGSERPIHAACLETEIAPDVHVQWSLGWSDKKGIKELTIRGRKNGSRGKKNK